MLLNNEAATNFVSHILCFDHNCGILFHMLRNVGQLDILGLWFLHCFNFKNKIVGYFKNKASAPRPFIFMYKIFFLYTFDKNALLVLSRRHGSIYVICRNPLKFDKKTSFMLTHGEVPPPPDKQHWSVLQLRALRPAPLGHWPLATGSWPDALLYAVPFHARPYKQLLNKYIN